MDDGGQGLPELYGTAACEMWNSADMAFALEPFLSSGAALAISAHGSDALKDKYLPNINAGVWPVPLASWSEHWVAISVVG